MHAKLEQKPECTDRSSHTVIHTLLPSVSIVLRKGHLAL